MGALALSNQQRRWVLVLPILVLSVRAQAQEPLCGIHSLYTAAILLDVEPRFGALLKSEFVGSDDGSSVAELQKAAETLGLHTLGVKRFTTIDLRGSQLPVILHVKTDLASTNYNHFVLFGGMHDGKARIYDGTNDVVEWTLGELASRWDGNALVLSKHPVNLSEITAASRWQVVYWSLGIGGVIALVLAMRKRVRVGAGRGWFGTAWREAALTLLVAGCGAWVFHATSPQGFLVGREGVHAIVGAHASSFLPRIDVREARELLAGGRALFVDARSDKEYQAAHIRGAVNLPAVLPEAQAIRIARTLPRDRRLVVYCSNALCSFSYATAQRLLQAGHEDVVIFTGGWKDWQGQAQEGPLASGGDQ